MSCRVIGRSLEDAFLAFIADECKKSGYKILQGHYIPTEKNAPVKDFYTRNGFELKGKENGVFIFEFPLAKKTILSPNWFKVMKQ